MILTVHFAAGALIAAKASSPILGILLAFASHFVIDLLPHKEYSIFNIKKSDWKKSLPDFLKVSLDIIFGILIIFFFSKNIPLAILGGVFAALPDGLSLFYFMFPKSKPLGYLLNLHRKTHWFENKNMENKIPALFAFSTQPIVILITIYLLRQ